MRNLELEDADERPGITFHPRDLVAMAVRQRRWIVIPLFAIGLLGFVAIRVWPYKYLSESVVLVQQQKVPDQYAVSAASSQEKLDHLSRLLLSRTRLEQLFRTLNLYTPAQLQNNMDDILLSFRKRIEITPIREAGPSNRLTAFRIGFSANTPELAQKVTQTLTSSLIDENRRAGVQQSEGTSSFLGGLLETAERELQKQEQRQRDLKAAYIGELPEQLQANVQMISSLQTQLQTKSAAVDRAEQQKIYLESVLSQLAAVSRARANSGIPQPSANGAPSPLAIAQATLRDMRKKLSDLLVTYTPQYPEVIRQQRLIADQEAEVKRLTTEMASAKVETAGGVKGDAGAALDMDPSAIEMRGRLNAADAELASAKREMAAVQKALQQAQARVNVMPLREQQFAAASRDYENAKANYQSLLKQKEQASLATDLIKQWDGDQFQQVEAASLPKHHLPPSRSMIILGYWAFGLFVGLALAAAREILNQSIWKPEDVERHGDLPVLASIPVLRTPAEVDQRRRTHLIEAAAAVSLVLITLAVGMQAFLFK
ncbi:MAG TPA: hypothetical protein VHD76_09585 [Bryobacteraceae bacterium]|jgi:polysaccharide chain length determinant protein (PEP-CTERM system associated)|nr:hypothetical protein [Bryobacteraceae bacterium]